MELKRYEQEEFERRLHAVTSGNLSFEEAFSDISQEAKDFIAYGTTKVEWENNDDSDKRIPLIFDRPDTKLST